MTSLPAISLGDRF